MVRAALVALCLLAPASAASAQTADWAKAGGDLFVGSGAEQAVLPVAIEDLGPPRLALPREDREFVEQIMARALANRPHLPDVGL